MQEEDLMKTWGGEKLCCTRDRIAVDFGKKMARCD